MKTVEELEQLMACMSLRFEEQFKKMEDEIADLKKKIGTFKVFDKMYEKGVAQAQRNPADIFRESMKQPLSRRGPLLGLGCSCSPNGHPHSYACKGWMIGDICYEDRCPRCGSYDHKNTGQGSCCHE